MNNFTSMVIAILEHLKVLSESEAEALAKELHGTMLRDTYKGCSAQLKEIYKKIDIADISKKVSSTDLEKEIAWLKHEVNTLKNPTPVKTSTVKKSLTAVK